MVDSSILSLTTTLNCAEVRKTPPECPAADGSKQPLLPAYGPGAPYAIARMSALAGLTYAANLKPGDAGCPRGFHRREGWRVLRRLRDVEHEGRAAPPWSRGLGRQPGVREGCEDKQLAADDRATLSASCRHRTGYP